MRQSQDTQPVGAVSGVEAASPASSSFLAAVEAAATPPGWATQNPFVLIALIPLVANLLGSAVNIWYNLNIVEPRLDARAGETFHGAIVDYNLVVYPLSLLLWYALLAPLVRCWRCLRNGDAVDEAELVRCRRLAVRAPVRGAQISVLGWLPSAVALPVALAMWAPPLDTSVYVHIPVSVLVSGIIAVTQTYLLIEILFIWLLYPTFFRDASPASVPGVRRLSLGARLLAFTVAVGVCPVVSLILLAFASARGGQATHYLELVVAVGGIGILFGIMASWLASRLILQPLQHLTAMARLVATGDFRARVSLQRADELGELIESFNHMTKGLAEKRRIEETFGRFVSPAVARTLLERDPALGGTLQPLTVVFVDVRDFTSRSSRSTPQQIVALLNRILPAMVDAIERHGGIINKFLGDGLMAMFGAPVVREGHADAAVAAARDMVDALERLNCTLVVEGETPVRIGVGIHTGPAVVGNVGTPRRMEYTAIGDTVNLAQRIEALTKEVGATVLLSDSARRSLQFPAHVTAFPGRTVKGIEHAVDVFRLDLQPDSGTTSVAARSTSA